MKRKSEIQDSYGKRNKIRTEGCLTIEVAKNLLQGAEAKLRGESITAQGRLESDVSKSIQRALRDQLALRIGQLAHDTKRKKIQRARKVLSTASTNFRKISSRSFAVSVTVVMASSLAARERVRSVPDWRSMIETSLTR